MDAIVHSAIEEICSQGTSGLTLPNLWPKVRAVAAANGLDLCPGVKAAVWTNLLEVPDLQLESQGVSYSFQRDSLILNDVEKCEQIDLKIVAPERLRDNFVGIYDVEASASSITPIQRRTLERLAIARTNGITQSDLAKEFDIRGNNIYYILKKLETRGLIVRQSTLVRTKEACSDREPKNTSVMTNMLYLHRYAKHLGSQKRLEIMKEDTPAAESDIADETTGSGFTEESVKEDVHVKDFLPALKAICDKLEEAEGKVLVVSDIKRDLNYRGIRGHRAWRNICKKLREAQIVEEFCAKVSKKEVACLRLLKKFSPTLFEAKSSGSGKGIPDGLQLIKSGKRGQITEQLVELSIEQQIYDMIDSEGSRGLTITEVMKRLGLRNKQYYDRLLHFFSRCGMHLQAENHNRGVAYRVWTSKNVSSVETDMALRKSEVPMVENTLDPSHPVDMEMHRESAESTVGVDSSTSKDNALVVYGVSVGPEDSHGAAARKECEYLLVSVENTHNCDSEPSGQPRGMDVAAFNSKPCDVPSLEVSPSAIATTSRRRSHAVYPCLTLSAANAQREQRILKMLEEEKFLIKADLHRRLENLEKEKKTIMDRRTLERCLNKLQKEGQCKCISFQVPVMTNLDSTRPTEVVLHPSTYDESPEVLCQKILERFRSFDLMVRRHSYSRLKKGHEVPVLDDIQRIPSKNMDNQTVVAEARRATGYVRGRMVRTKLLHIFLWSYLSDVISFGNIESDLNNPHSSWRLFELDAAVRAMPLQLYLQVIGSTEKSDDLIEKCSRGLRLSHLPLPEYRSLMDTRAMGRLSRLIDILRRLQLIRLISREPEDDTDKISQTTLTRALELKPYIEEPVSQVASYSGFGFQDLRPHVRHDFVLSTLKAVEEYWSTLEYCYAAVDSEAALHAFPGSAVPEVFRSRAWNSVRPMLADQRAELLRRVVVADPCGKLSFKECEGIAKDFNLTLEQVLRVYQDKRQRCLARLMGDSGGKGQENLQLRGKRLAASRKRKRNKQTSLKHSNAAVDDDLLSEEMFAHLSNRGGSSLTSSLAHACDLHQEHLVDQMEPPQEQEAGDDENISNLQLGTLSKAKSERRENFSWTEAADRQLIIEYVRHRAAMGPKFNCTNWSSLSNLPAPPDYCRRRMALLNSSLLFRKAVMRLCNLLADRYKKHLEKLQNNQSDLTTDRSVLIRKYAGLDCSEELASAERWDNFDEGNIMIALGDVLRCKRLAKLGSSEKDIFDEAADVYDNSHLESSPAPLSAGRRKLPARRSSIQRFPLKYSKILSKITRLGSKVYESIAVSNAVELFKLIFLSTSTCPKASSMLAETLRRYSQHDLFAAFSYLREKKAMIGGSGSKPFVLSQLFLQSIYLSPFPVNTGKRALKFASWLEESEKYLMEEEINLPADLQCGDIFHMCALVSSGELSMVPYLPEEGVGEVDSTIAKRKNDSSETCDVGNSKRMRTSTTCETEISRREKGFPNIRLSLSRVTIPRTHALDIFKDENHTFVSFEEPGNSVDVTVGKISGLDACEQEKEKEIIGSGGIVETALDIEKSPWDAMSSYTERLFSSSFDGDVNCRLCPELFKSISLAIQKSGDQGLCMKEISKHLEVKGEKELEIVVEVLETFGQALKVPAYNSIRLVDPLYRTKYFLTPLAGVEKLRINCVPNLDSGGIGYINDATVGNDVLQHRGSNMAHRVTILNRTEESIGSSTKILGTREVEDGASFGPIPCTTSLKSEMLVLHSGVSQTSSPILPWINGDGTINELVYKGLTRRLLGIVMQNPGIVEDDIISKMGALNPQSCKTLLETMILDNHIIVRKMHQRESAGPPSLLGSLFKSSMKKPKFNCRQHFFANHMSTTML